MEARVSKRYWENVRNSSYSPGELLRNEFGGGIAQHQIEDEDEAATNAARKIWNAKLNGVQLAPAVRDGGGLFRDRADIMVGKDRNEMVVAPERTNQLFQGLDSLKKMQRVVGREDLMRSDAQGFAAVAPANAASHTNVSHAGAVTLGLGEGVEEVISKLANTISKGAKGAGVRVGDKVYGPLM